MMQQGFSLLVCAALLPPHLYAVVCFNFHVNIPVGECNGVLAHSMSVAKITNNLTGRKTFDYVMSETLGTNVFVSYQDNQTKSE